MSVNGRGCALPRSTAPLWSVQAPARQLDHQCRARREQRRLAIGVGAGVALGVRAARARAQRWSRCSGPEAQAGPVRTLEDLSEEELLEYELAEEELDLEMDLEEEEEWRLYEQEVEDFEKLLSASDSSPELGEGAPSAAMLAAAVARTSEERAREEERLDEEALEGADEGEMMRQLEELGQQLGQSLGQPENTPRSLWAPGSEELSDELPEEYRALFQAEKDGSTSPLVVVSPALGPHAVVLLSRLPEQAELLPLISETFRLERLRILRGWLQTSNGRAVDAFEVCDAKTGEALTPAQAGRLETALVQAVRAPAARQALVEINGQIPRLEAFYGLPIGAPRPPGLSAARGALVDGPFSITESRDLGRALVFRGELRAVQPVAEVLDDCRQRLCRIGTGYDGKWECLLVDGLAGQLLVVAPIKEVTQSLLPTFDQTLVSMLAAGIAALTAQAAAPVVGGPTILPAGAMILAVTALAEVARRLAAGLYGVQLGPPILLPSPSVGTFGAAAYATSLVPNATALFDMSAAALLVSAAASLALIAIGLTFPPGDLSCTWVSPDMLPSVLRQLAYMQAETRQGICLESPAGLVPASAPFAAGSLGLLTTALNCLPLARLDGASLGASAPRFLRGTQGYLVWAVLLLLGSSIFSADSSLFPLIVSFLIFTFGVIPQLVPEPIFRDNVTQPRDPLRRCVSAVMILSALALLSPAGILDAGSEMLRSML
mmetsp:Transcript_36930/g.81041  ORF Transcript_36930/g.81041 Transcript_36930/m.81041 type:complete len:721 (-) Transcript_36930:78-2240(-)